jgi:protein-S-isoprenylcysteine O-methyltransferase Ste14
VTDNRRLLAPAVWAFYLVVVLEFLFMISPAALYFYASYGPLLNVLHASAWTSWLTGFFLPHFSYTTNPWIDALRPIGFVVAATGLLLFVIGAVHLYGAKLLRRGAATGGLYRFVRHPQYLALAILGLGTTLIWARFLVLVSYLTMLVLYFLLARWEEGLCAEKFGESYRDYQRTTGMIVPRILGRGGFSDRLREVRGTRLALLLAVTVVAGLATGFGLRNYSLAHVSGLYTGEAAVLSPAVLETEELEGAYRVAGRNTELEARLARLDAASRLIVYVVPAEWFLPDLPLHSLEEIRRVGGGHATPEFDRARYKVLFTQARLHSPATGKDIVKKAYGRDPILIVHVNVTTESVLGTSEPPDHVVWGDIPTPMF